MCALVTHARSCKFLKKVGSLLFLDVLVELIALILLILMVKTELCTLISRETCGILLVAFGVLFLRGSKKVIIILFKSIP